MAWRSSEKSFSRAFSMAPGPQVEMLAPFLARGRSLGKTVEDPHRRDRWE
jgi:hypothetical protein